MTHQDYIKNTLCILMAGGKGERLYPLTKDRAKPSVPFGGIYRIIDFTLSNCLNSNIRRIYVLTQYRSVSLDRHIRLGWNIFNHELDEFIQCIPPQMRNVDRWYRGTADSVFQNIYILQHERPERVLVLSGDHVYKMNYNSMLEFHISKEADVTVAGVEVDISQASAFGVVGCDEEFRITSWEEKPEHPKSVPGNPTKSFVSMGVYVFNTETLVRHVFQDAKDSLSDHDFGMNVVPKMVEESRVYVYKFQDATNPESRYWRDIGTLDAYWEANMDLVSPEPQCDLYDPAWPIRTYQGQAPPAKTTAAEEGDGVEKHEGMALDSILSGGCVIAGGTVQRSVLSYNVRIDSMSSVEDSVLLEGVRIGPRAKIRNAVIDQRVAIPEDFSIGYDANEDRKLFTVSPRGIVVVPRGMII